MRKIFTNLLIFAQHEAIINRNAGHDRRKSHFLFKFTLTKESMMNSYLRQKHVPVRAANSGPSQIRWQNRLFQWVVTGVFAVFSLGGILSVADAQAADECAINLENNTHTCQSVAAISFVSEPVNHQAVAKITLDPSSGYTKVAFDVTYNGSSTGWTVNIGDSPSNNGYGGDSGDTWNGAEMQIVNSKMSIYSLALGSGDSPLLLDVDNIVTQGDTVSFEVSNHHFAWTSPNATDELNSPRLYILDGTPDAGFNTVDYDIYAAFNRVIGSTRRSGSGASSVRVKLFKEPLVEPLVLTPKEFGSDELELKLSSHAQTRKLRFMAPRDDGGLSQKFSIRQPAGLSVSASPELAARHFLSAHGASFGLDQTTELALMREKVMNRGRSMARFQQAYNGIPVLGGEIIVQMDAAKNVMSVNGEISPGLGNLNTTPSVPAVRAGEIALATIAKQHQLNVSELTVSNPELWIYNPAILGAPGPQLIVLAWRMEVTPVKPLPIREFVLVDAHFGMVVLNFSQIHNALYREVYNNNNDPASPGTTPARIEDGGAIADSEVNNAYDYSGDMYNFYRTEHGRFGIDDIYSTDNIDPPAMNMTSRVRYCPDPGPCPPDYQNAFWDGLQVAYGNGFASADDVVGHEFTHGVTEHESKLFYFYQSGAINESFSDLWGEFIDQNNGSGNDSPEVRWLIGEDLPIDPIRDMANPAATPFNHPDKMSSSFYNCSQSNLQGGPGDAGGVHTNSGVNNKAVYLMTDGGTFNGFPSIIGIGYEKVADIYYEAQTNLLTSAADYADLYDALLQACINWQYSASDCEQVKNALDAVEMNQQPACPATEAPLCDNLNKVPVDLFFDDFESGSDNWTVNGTIVGTTTPSWFVPQTNSTIGLQGPYATSGTGNIWGFDQDPPFEGDTSDTSLSMNSYISLPDDAFMHFNHSYGFESDGSGTTYYDGGVLEYSTDSGSTWIDANLLISGTDNGYNGAVTALWDNPLVPVGDSEYPAFVADSRGYISTRLNLSSLATQNVRFRFRIGTDDVIYDYGWFIDDVRIYSCQSITDICANPNTQPNTQSTNGGGLWTDSSTWTNGVPVASTIAIINAGDIVTVAGSSSSLKVKGLCNYGTLKETTDQLLHIEAEQTVGFIYNEGDILGHDDQDRPIFSPSYSHPPPSPDPAITSLRSDIGADGSSIKLDAGSQFDNIGIIQAGHGRAGYLQGGDGGSVEVYARNITHSNGIIAAGNGGEGNAHQPAWDGFGSATGDETNIPVYGNINVFGGNGGRTVMHAGNSLASIAPAQTSSGTGGDSYVWCRSITEECGPAPGTGLHDDGRWWTVQCQCTSGTVAGSSPGNGGDLIKLSPTLNVNSTASSGQGLYYEPNTISAGADMHIEANNNIGIDNNIVIFGGDNWTLDLRNLSEEAISTSGDITLAVGDGSTIDLRGNTGKIFKAGGKLEVFTDSLLLDAGTSLESIADAEDGIVTSPSKILHRVVLNGPKKIVDEPNANRSIELELINFGPAADAYTMTVSDSAGWNSSALPSVAVVEGLGRKTLEMNVTFPPTRGEKDVIIVTATSQSDSSIDSVAEIHASVMHKYAISGTILDKQGNPMKGVTVTAGGNTVVTNDTGYWEIVDLAKGKYTLTASKDGYTFTPENVMVEGDEPSIKVNIEPPEPDLTAAFSVSPELGEAPLTVSLDGSASVDSDGKIVAYAWSSAPDGQTATGEITSLTFDEAGVYIVTLEVTDNDGNTAQTEKTVTVTQADIALVINEIDYDQGETDAGEFIEIKNIGNDPVDLSVYVLQLIDGTGTSDYQTIALSGNLAAGDYHVICAGNSQVFHCDQKVSPDTDFIRDGAPNAVSLIKGAFVLDTVSYEGDTPNGYTETAGAPADDGNTALTGLSRYPDGTDSNDNAGDFSLRCVTPGKANDIADNEACFEVSIDDQSVIEGDSGTVNAAFTISLSHAAASAVTVNVATADNTAAAGSDYTALASTQITFPANDNTAQTIEVAINGDEIDEGASEMFYVKLSDTSANAVLAGNQQGTGTITDDDTAGITVHSAEDLMTSESGAQATFTVVLKSEPAADVDIALSSSDTNEGTVSPVVLTFTAGDWNTAQTVTVTGVDDSPSVADGNIAYAIVTAAAASNDGNYNGLNPDDISVINNDDDVPPVAIFTATPTSGTAPLTVELDAGMSSDPDGSVVEHQWNVSDGQTASGVQASLTFNTAGTYKVTLAVTDNDGLSDTATQTIQVKVKVRPVEISFMDMRDFYYVNDTVSIKAGETGAGESRSEPVDLWMAVQTPGGEVFFRSPASAFSLEPQAFKTGIAPSETEHLVLESAWPFTEKGEYALYALYVQEGADPLTGDFLEVMRSNLASFTFNFLDLAEINFDGMQDSYEAGETVSITVAETPTPPRPDVDLWTAVQIPSGEVFFRTSSSSMPFSLDPQVFKAGIGLSDTVHPVFEFELPPGVEGEYTFYALYVREGADPLTEDFSIVQRSNIAVFQTMFRPLSQTRPISLQSGTFTPVAGIDPEMSVIANQAGGEGFHALVQFKELPDPGVWVKWTDNLGVSPASYLGDAAYVLRFRPQGRTDVELDQVFNRLDALALAPILPEYKIPPKVLAGEFEDWAHVDGTELVKIVATFFSGTSRETIDRIIGSTHSGAEMPEELGPLFWALQTVPSNIPLLIDEDAVYHIDQGPIPFLPLLDSARDLIGAESVQNIDSSQIPPDYQGLSGKGVRISTKESLDGSHEDFWEHDSDGNPTVSRIVGCGLGGSGHGTMTAGIALGNGWMSSRNGNGGTPYQWRGIAPQANFDCYGSQPDVSNHSYVQTPGRYSSRAASIDARIFNAYSGYFHPHAWAVANQGITSQYYDAVGYYSVYAPAKNPIVVANIDPKNFRWQHTSIGPTLDGRIKPDISAPGSRYLVPDKAEIFLDLDYVALKNGETTIIQWDFDTGVEGWGEEAWWGRQNIEDPIQITEGSINALRVPFKFPPYGGYTNRPSVGTSVKPTGAQLNISGNLSDEIEIRYRFEAIPELNEADMELRWATPKTDYYKHYGINFPIIADGQWNTVTINVGE
ncbi:MAG: PKD domain-containing protein, partial [Planctomycetes bacterium]|nr:PKD domain-containing protein [Planctomycetota bacterium]